MAEDTSLLIEPPAVTRPRAGKADSALADRMADTIKEGAWISDGATHKNHRDAGNTSQVYRRAIASRLNVPPHKIKSRVWGMKNGVLLADTDKSGEWRFALTLDHSRVKRARKSNGSA